MEFMQVKKKFMIEIMQTLPSNVVGFRATGKVEKDDYDQVIIPQIDALVKEQDKINFLLVLDTSIGNFSAGAILKDLGVGLKHFTKWHKMAIVSESSGINTFTDIFSYIAPGEAKSFTHDQLPEAIQWVSN
jgi:SpoIIAA-like